VWFNESKSLKYYRLRKEDLINTIKHTKAKYGTVSIKNENTRIIALITNNSKSFDVDDRQREKSLGLKIVFERIRIMNGNISDDIKRNKGTSFMFSIPIQNPVNIF